MKRIGKRELGEREVGEIKNFFRREKKEVGPTTLSILLSIRSIICSLFPFIPLISFIYIYEMHVVLQMI